MFARPSTTRSFRPRLRMVSIMPGIDMGDPERTETSRGLVASPNFFPVRASSEAIASRTEPIRPVGRIWPLR